MYDRGLFLQCEIMNPWKIDSQQIQSRFVYHVRFFRVSSFYALDRDEIEKKNISVRLGREVAESKMFVLIFFGMLTFSPCVQTLPFSISIGSLA